MCFFFNITEGVGKKVAVSPPAWQHRRSCERRHGRGVRGVTGTRPPSFHPQPTLGKPVCVEKNQLITLQELYGGPGSLVAGLSSELSVSERFCFDNLWQSHHACTFLCFVLVSIV